MGWGLFCEGVIGCVRVGFVEVRFLVIRFSESFASVCSLLKMPKRGGGTKLGFEQDFLIGGIVSACGEKLC